MKHILVFCASLFSIFLFTNVASPGQQDVEHNKVLMFEGKAANPLLIHAFMPWPGDRPAIISIDLTGGHNRFFSPRPIDSTSVELENGMGRFSYTCLGKTNNNIYVVRTTLVKGNSVTQDLLFFSFNSRQMIYEGVKDPVKQPLITLEKFYMLPKGKDAQVIITGNKVTVNVTGEEQKNVVLSTENDNGSQAIQDNSYPPAAIAHSTIQKDWEEANTRFYFHDHPINPHLLNELIGGDYSMSDGPYAMAIDVEAGSADKQFKDTSGEKGTGFSTPIGDNGFISSSRFKYEYLGKTTNGVHVVRTIESGGGSGSFPAIRFIRFRIRKGFDCNGVSKDQLLMCLERSCSERDRSNSIVKIKGNTVTMDIPERSNWDSEAYDTTHIVTKW